MKYTEILLGEESTNSYLVVAILKEKVVLLQEMFRKLKVDINSITPDFTSLSRLMELKEQREERNSNLSNIMVVDIGYKTTKICIFHEDQVMMHRMIPIGGNSFTEIIQNRKSLSYKEAEDMKKSILIPLNINIAEESYPLIRDIYELMDDLNNQLEMSIKYYNLNNSYMGIDKVLLTGGGAIFGGLLEKIAEHLDIDTEYLTPIKLGLKLEENFKSLAEKNHIKYGALVGSSIEEVM